MSGQAVHLSARLTRAKRSYVTRHVDLARCERLLDDVAVNDGDLLLARVGRIRQHPRLELVDGRRAHLYPDDEIILSAGRRYASDQFTAELPELGAAHLAAAGGIAAQVVSRHAKMKPPTEIEILGVLADSDGVAVNLKQFGWLPEVPADAPDSGLKTLLVVGTGMNSGKTTLASTLVHSLGRMGGKVMAVKLTGTGSGPDVWRFLDAGATQAYDFTDAGLSGTWQHPTPVIIDIAERFTALAKSEEMDYLVIELADGFLQQETHALLSDERFRGLIDGCFTAADCAPGALMLAQLLAALGLPVLGISGLVTRSPLLIDEVAARTGLPVPTIEQLSNVDDLNRYLGILGMSR